MKKSTILSIPEKLICFFAAALFLLAAAAFGGKSLYAAETDLNVNQRTAAEIKAFVKSHKASGQAVSYAQKPSLKTPYSAGELSAGTLNSALNQLNQIRYVAGLDADVTLNDTYTQKAQAGVLLNAVNGGLSHTPSQPSDMSDDLYELGYSGAGSSNIAWGYSDLDDAVLYGWMSDADSSNISMVGHRRWILNPSMGQTGFGAVGSYYAMYAFDGSNDSSYSNVAWPAQTMPYEWFDSGNPWSLSTGTKEDEDSVKVTLTRKSDGKKWTFSSGSSNGDFYVNNDGYGAKGCIIFAPSDIKYTGKDSFTVKIEGLVQGTLTYTVNFFELSGHDYESEVTKKATYYNKGTRTYTCSKCGDTYTKEIPAKTLKKGDIFKDKTKKAVYKVTGKDTVEYKKPIKKTAKITIPKTITAGETTYKVTSVGSKAFQKNKKLKSVVISSNVKKIGAKAFYGCKNLKKVTIQSKVLNKIGSAVFKKAGAKKLTVKVPSKKKKAYKKLLKKAGLKKSAKVK